MTNLIINEQQIRERIPASANVEMSLLRPNILLYQETRLEEILGSTFYNHFVTAYINGNLSNDEILLLGHIHPTIAFGGLYITIPFLAAQISNRGIINQSGDFTAPAPDTTLRLLRESVGTSTHHYEERLIKFLKLNKSLYPLWKYDKDAVQNPETQSPNDFGMILNHFKEDKNCGSCL